MKLGAKARGWVVAAVACAACVGSWTALVRADIGIARFAGVYREVALTGACLRAVHVGIEANPELQKSSWYLGAHPALVCDL